MSASSASIRPTPVVASSTVASAPDDVNEAFRTAGGSPRHTEYPDLGHTVFAWAYTEPALVEWLFAQKR